MKFTIAETADEARSQIIEIDNIANIGKWKKAAICYAYRTKHYEIIGDARAADEAAAEELNTPGYGNETIRRYTNRWVNAELPDVRPGDEVEIPDLDWEAIEGGSSGKTKRIKEMAEKIEELEEQIANDPEASARAKSDLKSEILDGESPLIENRYMDASLEMIYEDMQELCQGIWKLEERDRLDKHSVAASIKWIDAIQIHMDAIRQALTRDTGWDDALAELMVKMEEERGQ